MIKSRGKRAVIYVRESMDRWGDERAVDRFEQECRTLCGARSLTVVKVLRDNDVRASGGNKGDGFAEVKRMLRNGETDYVVIPVVDRFFRSPRDLEDVIDICLKTGASLVAASGEIDLSHDQGRLVARLLVSVAKAETERKGARQRTAYVQAVRAGKRRVAGPRPFGWDAVYAEDEAGNRQRTYVMNDKEAKAIRWAADHLLGGGSVAAAVRRWTEDGITGVQTGRPISRTSFITVMRNPRIGGLTCLPRGKDEQHGEIIGRGNWEPVIPEETWRAVDALLGDPGRKPSRGTRTLLGGIARCPCGTPVTSAANHRGYRVYRCNPEQRRDGATGPHVSVKAATVNEYVERVVLEVLASDELADIVTVPPEVDTVGLRREAKSIRGNLEEMAADRALGLVTRAQMIAATEKGNARLDEIAAELAGAAGAGALAPFISAPHRARELWDGLDLSRRREVVRALGNVTLLSPRRGVRVFDPGTVQIESPAGKELAARALRTGDHAVTLGDVSGAQGSRTPDNGAPMAAAGTHPDAWIDPGVWDLLAAAERALREQNAQDLHRVLGKIITTPGDGLGPAQRAELREQFYAVGRALVRLDPEWGRAWTEDSFMIAELALRDRQGKLLASPFLLLEWVLARLASRARHRVFVTRATRPASVLAAYRSVVFARVIPACGPPARVPIMAGTAG